MKIVTIIGARPQFIKASVLSNLIKNESHVEEVIIHTGQHFDSMMSDVFFNDLDIPKPKYNLNISSLSHGAMTGRMIEEIEKILIDEKPDLTLVYGDTNSTLSGALASSKLHIPVAHIESGLRSFNTNMPEEINRKLTDHISKYLFCPTLQSLKNLLKENIVDNVELVGDIMYDSFLHYSKLSNREYSTNNLLNLKPKDYCLLTLHRQENTNNFSNIYSLFIILKIISNNYGYKFVFPMHPRIALFLMNNNFNFKEFENIQFISPVSYLDMIELEKNSKIILTDSGGVQKEAFWANVPCITLREETEWVELLNTGMNILTGMYCDEIFKAFSNFISKESIDLNLYGDGKTGQKILDCLR